ncbi:MAG TPA: hypothetical protein VF824_12760 [Thermoanaerobaculia bacterium]|jgi:uncharacterized protein YgiB involved in biofilm formation
MKKILTLFAFAALAASSSFAAYVVVLRDGTSYVAKSKWTVVNGKALVQLTNGQSISLDPSLIDVAKSEQATKLGLTSGNVSVLDLNTNMPDAQVAKPQGGSLGSQIKLRKTPANPADTATPAPSAPPPVVAGSLPARVLENFDRAFENVGIFEKKVTSTGARSLRADLTTDTEERVFNAISAASFLLVRNAGVEGAQIDMVELFMKTTTGGAAGRFQMTRADAESLDKVPPASRQQALQDYFIRKVLY